MLLIEIKNIFESGKSFAKQKIDWETKPNGFAGNLVEDGLTYQIRLIIIKTNAPDIGIFYNKLVYNIQFGLVNGPNELSMAKTGKMNSAVIMNIVQNEAWAKLKTENLDPDIISLSVSTDPFHNNHDDVRRRVSLYTRFANKLGPINGYPEIYSNIPGKISINVIMSKFKIEGNDMAILKRKLLNN